MEPQREFELGKYLDEILVSISPTYKKSNIIIKTHDPQYSKVTVPKGYIYVLGDNRLPGASKDSRTFGPVKLDRVRGVVLFRLFPLNKFGSVK
jgi:signal peptidase I